MNQKINLYPILKDKIGLTIWSKAFGNVTIDFINTSQITCKLSTNGLMYWKINGKLWNSDNSVDIDLFPSKNQQDWKLFEYNIENKKFINSIEEKHKNQKPEISLFQAIKNIFNNNNLIYINRKELIIKLFEKYKYYNLPQEQKTRNYGHPTDCYFYSLNTMDNIRNMLEKVGFLSKYYDKNKKYILGYYCINRKIPEDLTYNKLRKMYNNFKNKLKNYFDENNEVLSPDNSNHKKYYDLQTKNYLEFYDIIY